MSSIVVNLDKRSYKVEIGTSNLSQLSSFLENLNLGKDILIVTNPTVRALHGDKIEKTLRKAGFRVGVEEIPDGEQYKTAATMGELCGRLRDFDRDEPLFIVAFGGGVVGDVSGFAAAVYKRRGVPYIQVPTTLLAQVDCCIGGKVGVNIPQAKNIIGRFYQPSLVFIDLSWLETLPVREVRSGLAEIIKYGMISDVSLFKLLQKNWQKIMRFDEELLERIILRCCQIKAKIVEKDEMDVHDVRILLNLGHTVGHAIEAASKYLYRHGEAVALGLLCAAEISQRLDKLEEKQVSEIEDLLLSLRLPTQIQHCDAAAIMQFMQTDKKFINGKNRFILLEDIGKPIIVEDIDENLIRDILTQRMNSRSKKNATRWPKQIHCANIQE